MRKNYIDNLRWLTVLLLFPYHILMIYNSFGENFYVKGADIGATTTFLYVTYPWFMPVMFSIAGISAAYALEKRRIFEYAKERTAKLLVPLIAGLLLIVPAQTYFAERFHNGYTGGYWEQYILFFTKPTDLTGYTGGFTPGQLWFAAYLFVISVAAIPLIYAYKKAKRKPNAGKLPLPFILCLCLLPTLGALILDIGGKSLGEYFAYFILGYFCLADDRAQDKMAARRFSLLGVSVVCAVIVGLHGQNIINLPCPAYDIFLRFYAWNTILALIGLSKRYLNVRNKLTAYMSNSSFAVYLFHQTMIVTSAYYVFSFTNDAFVQMMFILIFSVASTFLIYEVCRRIAAARFLFAIKK